VWLVDLYDSSGSGRDLCLSSGGDCVRCCLRPAGAHMVTLAHGIAQAAWPPEKSCKGSRVRALVNIRLKCQLMKVFVCFANDAGAAQSATQRRPAGVRMVKYQRIRPEHQATRDLARDRRLQSQPPCTQLRSARSVGLSSSNYSPDTNFVISNTAVAHDAGDADPTSCTCRAEAYRGPWVNAATGLA
jgi:hypothetical protein